MADKQKTVNELRALAAGTEGRSESRRLRDIITEVETALAAGVGRKTILATLHTHYGFTMSMSGFEKALKRARGQRPTSVPEPEQTNAESVAASLMPTRLPVPVGPAKPVKFESPNAVKKWLAEEKERIEQEMALDDFVDDWPYEEKHENSGD